MRTPRYYVMPADRGSDILCMLMPHNVGFVPLFSIYLLGERLLRIRFTVALLPRFRAQPRRGKGAGDRKAFFVAAYERDMPGTDVEGSVF